MVTKKEIEAELNLSDLDAAVARAREMAADFQEFLETLRAEEREVWQPHWSHSDPLRDRLLRTGRSLEAVQEFEARLKAMQLLILGKPVPPQIQKELDDADAAGNAALQQLADVQRKHKS